MHLSFKSRDLSITGVETDAIVEERFFEPQKCGHCGAQANPRFIRRGNEPVVAVACPSGYISKVIAYGTGDNTTTVKSLVGGALGSGGDLSDEDIRSATRYAWDLGMEDKAKGKVFGAAYWNQNYRRTKSDAPNRNALFSCARCGSLFVQPVSSSGVLCAVCSAH